MARTNTNQDQATALELAAELTEYAADRGWRRKGFGLQITEGGAEQVALRFVQDPEHQQSLPFAGTPPPLPPAGEQLSVERPWEMQGDPAGVIHSLHPPEPQDAASVHQGQTQRRRRDAGAE